MVQTHRLRSHGGDSQGSDTACLSARGPDAVIRDIAATQHGVVARFQLKNAGVPAHLIKYRVRAGRLRPLFRGVYWVGPVRARYQRQIAAVLACGESAVLSHMSAARFWGILGFDTEESPIHVGVRGGFRRPGLSVRVHRIALLPPNETSIRSAIPITYSPSSSLIC